MSKIVILSGSPSEVSRTDMVLKHIASVFERRGFLVSYVSVLDFLPEDLVFGRFNSLDIKNVSKSIENAEGIVIGSPVYKASYTGVLKSLLDLLPESAFKNKPVLPLMVGGSMAHLLAIDFSLKPLITTLKGKSTQGIYLLDNSIDKTNKSNPINDKELLYRLYDQVEEFEDALKLQKQITVQ